MCRRWRQKRKQVAIGSLTNETEYGDASACLCLSHPVDPTRPAARHFKWRAADPAADWGRESPMTRGVAA
jgi:hypothetical protein